MLFMVFKGEEMSGLTYGGGLDGSTDYSVRLYCVGSYYCVILKAANSITLHNIES
ncbi:hypothetical protein Ptc2401_01875 [Prosthecochloris sp. CIB 2401]|nr:hypothetical protein Ptc2401_01875 [Prosthecochloris sp. CIB 2401]